MKTIYLTLFTLFFTTGLQAGPSAACTFDIDRSSVKLQWTAFKTNDKIGVPGTFTKNQWSFKPAASVNELIKSLKFNIKTSSMSSGSWIRDKRVIKNFFKLMNNGEQIKGHGISYNESDGKSIIEVNMNGQRTPVVFKTVFGEDNGFQLLGSIDVLKHFKMKKSYEKIAKVCEKLHMGSDGVSKTWTTVDLQITGKIIKKCQP